MRFLVAIDFSSSNVFSLARLPRTIWGPQTTQKRCSELRTREIRDDDDGWGKHITMTNRNHQERTVDQRQWWVVKVWIGLAQSRLDWLQDELSNAIVTSLVHKEVRPASFDPNCPWLTKLTVAMTMRTGIIQTTKWKSWWHNVFPSLSILTVTRECEGDHGRTTIYSMVRQSRL